MALRSQEGLAFDPKTGRLWETEHGPRGGDELNIIEKGKNYGWPVIAHGIDYPGTAIGEGITHKEGMEEPVYYWDPVIAPSGLAFYTGNLFPQWKDSVFVGGLRGMMLDRLTIVNDKVVAEEPLLTDLHARIRDVRVGPDGAVYVLTDSGTSIDVVPYAAHQQAVETHAEIVSTPASKKDTMHSIIFAAMLALNLGPMGPDAPAREPQLAASGSTVALTFGAGSAIYFSVSHDSGRTFSAPVKVEQASNVVLTHHRGPRIAISGKTIVISAIASKTAQLG